MPITVLTQAIGDDEYAIEIKKTVNDFIEGKIFEIEIELFGRSQWGTLEKFIIIFQFDLI